MNCITFVPSIGLSEQLIQLANDPTNLIYAPFIDDVLASADEAAEYMSYLSNACRSKCRSNIGADLATYFLEMLFGTLKSSKPMDYRNYTWWQSVGADLQKYVITAVDAAQYFADVSVRALCRTKIDGRRDIYDLVESYVTLGLVKLASALRSIS
jgi:hypothetical protein